MVPCLTQSKDDLKSSHTLLNPIEKLRLKQIPVDNLTDGDKWRDFLNLTDVDYKTSQISSKGGGDTSGDRNALIFGNVVPGSSTDNPIAESKVSD